MVAILEMPHYVAYQKNIVYGWFVYTLHQISQF